jgi:hypothetical protein
MRNSLTNPTWLRCFIFACLLLALALPALSRIPDGQTGPDPATSLAGLQKAIKAAQDRLAEAGPSLQKAESIVAIPAATDKDPLSVAQITQAAQTLKDNDITAASKLTGLKTALTSLQTGDKSLTTLKDNLAKAKDTLDGVKGQLMGDASAQAQTALAEAPLVVDRLDKAIGRLNAIGLSDNALALDTPIKGAYTSAGKQVAALQEALQNSALGKLDTGAKAAEIRQKLLGGLNKAASVSAASDSLALSFPVFKAVLPDDTAPPAPDALETDLKAQAAKLDPLTATLIADTSSSADTLTQKLQTILAAFDKTPRDRAVIYGALGDLRVSRTQVADLRDIVSGMQTLLVTLKSKSYDVQATENNTLHLTQATDDLANSNQYLDDLLTGDGDRFVQDQVRLFYFTDVPRLIQSINPDAHLVKSDDVTTAKLHADNLRSDLLNTEGSIAKLTESKNALQQRKRDLQEHIRQTQAQLNDANNRLSTANTAVNALNQATLQQTVIQKQIDELDGTRRTVLTQEQTDLTAQQTAAKTKGDQKEVDRLQRLLDRNASQQKALDAQIRQLKVRKSNLAVQQTDQADALSKAQDAVTQIQSQKAGFQAELDQLPAQQNDLEKQLVDAQVQRSDARRQQALLAQQEAEAFGEFRDNQPFWVAEPTAAAGDPAKRVIIYGYEDSKTIFLRGMARDVQRVKEMIASFDRPAPQARVTLWTMQLNGSGKSKDFNTALKNVDDVLRDLRGSINIVQNELRNSITEEVNRASEIARLASFQDDRHERYRDRMARYFYYSKETRDLLGFRVGLPEERISRATIQYELDTAKKYYLKANQASDAISGSSVERRLVQKFRDERESDLREAVFHLEHAQRVDRRAGLNLGLNNHGTRIADLTTLFFKLFIQIARDEDDRRDLDRAYRSAFANANATDSLASLIDSIHITTKRELESNVFYATELPDGVSYADAEYVTRWTLPDPAHATTLGEMLFVLSLGDRDSRESILQRFILNLERKYANQPQGKDTSKQKNALQRFRRAINKLFRADEPDANADNTGTQGYPHFPDIVLGGEASDVQQDAHDREMTANQLEILTALQAKARERVSTEVRLLLRQIGDLYQNGRCRDDETARRLRYLYRPLLGYLHGKYYEKDKKPEDDKGKTWYMQGEAVTYRPKKSGNKQDEVQGDFAAWQITDLVHEHNSLAQAIPRVAAADDMIKRMIIVAEDDIDYFFVGPAFDSIRANANARGVELGTIQRESVLATNRLVARVDPRASAALTLDNGTNFLDAAQQLAQIAGRIQENQRAAKLTQTAPVVVSAINGLVQGNPATALAFGGIASLLGDLAARPQQPAGEIYSINTGSTFKITPIFDPSGQALRFKFDYAAVTNLQEPDGTTTPDFSRVDRHTVNTEVQLTNLELREISRFESNAKLGTPAIRTGGIPILNQIPLLRDIPIIGYYYRRKAEAASRQESLIFAQTSLYPTVGDIVDLLTDVPPRTDLDPEMPDYLHKSNPALTSLTITPTAVIPGATAVGTVMLDSATVQDTLVDVSSPEGVTLDPVNVVIPTGQSSATFKILIADKNGPPVGKSIAITARRDHVKKSTSLTITKAPLTKPPLFGVEILTKKMVANGSGTVRVKLLDAHNQPLAAPEGGLTFTLDTNSPAVHLCAPSVTVKEKETEAALDFTTDTVAMDTYALISASLYGVLKADNMLIMPLSPVRMTADRTTVRKGEYLSLRVLLNGSAPSSKAILDLLSNDEKILRLSDLGHATVFPTKSVSEPFRVKALSPGTVTITSMYQGRKSQPLIITVLP